MRVIISAGGTGGHIYPALAILNKIKEKEPNSEFLYIGTHNRMEKDLVPELGIKFIPLEVYGYQRKLTLKNIKSYKYFMKARKECLEIINDFKPNVVVGCGGYVTAPVICAAHKLGIKTLVHEQNSVVGLSNHFLSRFASKIAVSFKSTMSKFNRNKVVLTGNPCSEKALTYKPCSKSEFNLSLSKKLVLIVMGSLGSKTINDRIVSMIPKFKDKEYEIMFVTGPSYYEGIKNIKIPINVHIVPFVFEMPRLMKVTDLMISRAGASTISEITALAIPTIFIPSPYVPNNHQFVNAMDLVNQNSACILEEKDLSSDTLIPMIDELLNNSIEYNKIKNNLKNIGINDSATRIYNVLVEMVRHHD